MNKLLFYFTDEGGYIQSQKKGIYRWEAPLYQPIFPCTMIIRRDEFAKCNYPHTEKMCHVVDGCPTQQVALHGDENEDDLLEDVYRDVLQGGENEGSSLSPPGEILQAVEPQDSGDGGGISPPPAEIPQCGEDEGSSLSLPGEILQNVEPQDGGDEGGISPPPADHPQEVEPHVGGNIMVLPVEILMKICQYMDSLDLWNLSQVNNTLRSVCWSLVKKSGIMYYVWKKNKDTKTWEQGPKCWSFSKVKSDFQVSMYDHTIAPTYLLLPNHEPIADEYDNSRYSEEPGIRF